MLTDYSERELLLKHVDTGDVAHDYGHNEGDYRVTRGNFSGGLCVALPAIHRKIIIFEPLAGRQIFSLLIALASLATSSPKK